MKPIGQVCVLLVLPNKRGKNESHSACMELWRTSTTVASSHDLLLHTHHSIFSCVSLHPGNLSWAFVYIFFFSPLVWLMGEPPGYNFFSICAFGKKKTS